MLREDDVLENVALTDGESNIMLATNKGKAICFEESKVRSMGRVTQGVTALKMAEGDRVVNMAVIDGAGEILTITENGYGKRSDVSEYRITGRGGKGIITHGLNENTGDIVDMAKVTGEEDILLITSDGTIIRTPVSQIRTMGRSTQGVRVMRVADGVKVVAFATAPHEEEKEEIQTETVDAAETETAAETSSENTNENTTDIETL